MDTYICMRGALTYEKVSALRGLRRAGVFGAVFAVQLGVLLSFRFTVAKSRSSSRLVCAKSVFADVSFKP